MLRNLLRYVLLGLVLLVVFLVSALLAMRFAIHGREVRVPNMAGLAPAAAERLANAEGLVISIDSRFYSSSVPEGRIISQAPPANATVRRGWKVFLAQSLGPQRADIPNLIGQSEHAATVNLRGHGLEVGSVATIRFAGEQPQTVLSQNPLPNSNALASPRIALVISAPENPRFYVMPSFNGKSLAEAAGALEEAGLRLGNAPRPANHAIASTKPAPPLVGTVVRQYPPAGDRVATGSAVYFEVKK